MSIWDTGLGHHATESIINGEKQLCEISKQLCKISKQLTIANELKAVELKEKYDYDANLERKNKQC